MSDLSKKISNHYHKVSRNEPSFILVNRAVNYCYLDLLVTQMTSSFLFGSLLAVSSFDGGLGVAATAVRPASFVVD